MVIPLSCRRCLSNFSHQSFFFSFFLWDCVFALLKHTKFQVPKLIESQVTNFKSKLEIWKANTHLTCPIRNSKGICLITKGFDIYYIILLKSYKLI